MYILIHKCCLTLTRCLFEILVYDYFITISSTYYITVAHVFDKIQLTQASFKHHVLRNLLLLHLRRYNAIIHKGVSLDTIIYQLQLSASCYLLIESNQNYYCIMYQDNSNDCILFIILS